MCVEIAFVWTLLTADFHHPTLLPPPCRCTCQMPACQRYRGGADHACFSMGRKNACYTPSPSLPRCLVASLPPSQWCSSSSSINRLAFLIWFQRYGDTARQVGDTVRRLVFDAHHSRSQLIRIANTADIPEELVSQNLQTSYIEGFVLWLIIYKDPRS